MNKRHITTAFFSLAFALLIAGTACETVREKDATATAGAGGVDREFLIAEATEAAENGNFDDRLLIVDATATAAAGGHDPRLEIIEATSEAQDAIYDVTSTAEAIEDAAEETAEALESENDDTVVDSGDRQVLKRAASEKINTPTPLPAPTATAAPAATPVPPTATTQAIVLNQWLTAFQAIELLSKQQSGTVVQVVAHVSARTGQFGSGDLTASIPSPGAGYAAMWEMGIADGDGLFFCTVWLQGTSCNPTSYAEDSDVTGADVDSTDVFAIWAGVPEWIDLMRNDDISILMVLKSSAGAGSALLWQSAITVHGVPIGLGGGNFVWNPETGETSFTTY